MPLHAHNLLILSGNVKIIRYGVGVEVADGAIFGAGEEVVGVFDELEGRDGVFVDEQRAVAVTEVQSPDLDVFIGGSRH
jgi:hypothetical protein